MTKTALLVLAACSSASSPAHPKPSVAPLSLAADAQMVAVPAGQYVAGSTPEERIAAYEDYEKTSGHDIARLHHWFDIEEDRHTEQLGAYKIDLMPVTQAEYSEFVGATQGPAPTIDEIAWKAQGFAQDYATQVARYVWREGRPPLAHEDHPVVLVTWVEADRYCKWRGEQLGEPRRLPTEGEYEKAARGDSGLAYPWGNSFDPERLNSAIKGPGDTTPVGTYLTGASPYGALDMAGNVFEWTSTSFADGQMTVKGSAWEDYAGVGRGASRHGRATNIRHAIIGFRCAADAR